MASAQVDLENNMKDMVLSFRVSELQCLLGHAGRNKSGRKQDLVNRAMEIIRATGCSKSIQDKILELYAQRFPHLAANMKLKPSFHHAPSKMDAVANPYDAGRRSTSYPSAVVRQHSTRKENYLGVKFKPLPFYEQISEILAPSSVVAQNSNMLQECTYKFQLSPQHAMKIQTGNTKVVSKDARRDVQVQLRFCELDTSCIQEDKLPPNLSVKVNNHTVLLPPFIPPTKSGMEQKRTNRPLNITSLCLNSLQSEFIVEVKWSSNTFKTSSTNYALTINLVEHLSVDDLLRKLRSTGVADVSASKAMIEEKFSPDADIKTTSLKVSLLCPLGKMRMKLPTRPITCRHLQCFDAASFLMMNARKPTWTCPVCDSSADFCSLRIDGFFTEILDNSDSDEIEFREDGSWHSAKKKTESLVVGTTNNNPIDLSRTATSGAKSEKRNNDVIDLTCDSSDDETSACNLAPNPLNRVRDNTPMSVSSSPIELGNSNFKTNYKLDPLRKSPLQKPSSKSYSSPTRSPYYRCDSPYYRTNKLPSHTFPFAPISPPELTPHPTPPLKQNPMLPHMPRYHHKNILDTPPNIQIPSPHLNGTTPQTLNGRIPSLSPLEVGMDGFQPSMGAIPGMHLPLGFPSALGYYDPQILNALRLQQSVQSSFFHPLYNSLVPPFNLSSARNTPNLSLDTRTADPRLSSIPHDDAESYSDAIRID